MIVKLYFTAHRIYFRNLIQIYFYFHTNFSLLLDFNFMIKPVNNNYFMF